MRKNKDFFEAIAEYEHNVGIYLTYTLDNLVIEKLSESSSAPKLILHDYRQGVSLDDNVDNSIVCLPAKTHIAHQQNCFHSKLALLKSETGAKLIVGSTNLHRNSFKNEINVALELELSFFDKQKKLHSGNVFIYNAVIDYLQKVAENHIILGKDYLKEALKKPDLKETSSDIKFIYSSEQSSIFMELQKYLLLNKRNEEATNIKVLSPYISKNYSDDFISEVKNLSSNVSVYLLSNSGSKTFLNLAFSVFRPKNNKPFHSKVFLIEYSKDVIVYIGSANFSEQGFFKNLTQAGNQECGIVFTGTKDLIENFFGTNNWVPITEAEANDSDENLEDYEEFKLEPYAWAEKVNNQIITYIFRPEKLEIYDSNKKEKKEIIVEDVDLSLCLFKTDKLKPSGENKISFYIDNKEIPVSIYEFTEYKQAINERKGESIFYLFKKQNSIVPEEMDDAIGKDHLTASAGNFYVIEPPKLEQYWRNVKDLINSIKDKEVFWDNQLKEIEDVLAGKINVQGKQQVQMDEKNIGRYLYLAIHLLKLAKQKKQARLESICEQRILELAQNREISIDKKKLNTFIKSWCRSTNF